MRKRENNGITLIALVITVIVLLILAGVAITMLSGENGILRQAASAKTEYEEKSKEENEGLFLQTLEMYEATGKDVSLEEVVEEAKQYGIDKDFDINSNLKYKGKNDDIKEKIMKKYVISDLLKPGVRYSVVDGVGYFTGDEIITAEEISAKGYSVYKTPEVDTPLTNVDLGTTGYTLKNSDEEILGIRVTYGDINSAGGIEILDSTELTSYLNGSTTFDNIRLIASDVNGDGVLTVDDEECLLSYLSRKFNINQNVEAKKVEAPEYITEIEAIKLLGIAKANKIEETELEIGGEIYKVYEIELNKQYTYNELYTHINNRLGNKYTSPSEVYGSFSLMFSSEEFIGLSLFEKVEQGINYLYNPTEFSKSVINNGLYISWSGQKYIIEGKKAFKDFALIHVKI